MTSGGNVTVSVSLGLDRLRRDTEEASRQIRSAMQSAEKARAITFENAGIAKLAQDVLKAKAGLADTGSAVFLQKEAALLQESLRLSSSSPTSKTPMSKKKISRTPSSSSRNCTNSTNSRFDRDFKVPELAAPRGLAGQAQVFQEAVDKASLYTQALSQVSDQLLRTGDRINDFTKQAAAAAIAFDDARAKFPRSQTTPMAWLPGCRSYLRSWTTRRTQPTC
jgi:hypothetical protein